MNELALVMAVQGVDTLEKERSIGRTARVAVVSAYCSGCGRRIELTPAGECPQGHLRSMLRDVRQGVAAPAAPVGSSAAERAPRTTPPPVEPSRAHELLAQVLGKAIVIVPAAVIIAFGLWTGYESVAGAGVSVLGAILMSVGSLVLTVGLAFVWASRRGRKR